MFGLRLRYPTSTASTYHFLGLSAYQKPRLGSLPKNHDRRQRVQPNGNSEIFARFKLSLPRLQLEFGFCPCHYRCRYQKAKPRKCAKAYHTTTGFWLSQNMVASKLVTVMRNANTEPKSRYHTYLSGKSSSSFHDLYLCTHVLLTLPEFRSL